MYIDISKTKLKNGEIYTRALLRTSYREDGKVKHKTIANLSGCTNQEIEAMRFALKNKENLPEIISKGTQPDITFNQGLSYGSVYTVYEIAKRLGIAQALGNTHQSKLALWQIIARVIDQGSRLSAVRLASSHAAVDVLGINNTFTEDDLYENLDWISENQNKIEQKLFKNRYPDTEPKLFLYDVTSSYFEGQHNELAAFGYNRDNKKGKKQIVIGLLCDEHGIPLSIEVFKGNTSDVKTMPEQITKVSERFGCREVTFVGDRGMIKNSVIEKIEGYENFHYITALTKPQIETLIQKDVIQLSLFDTQIVEINDQEENIRYILRRNPIRAEEIQSSRLSKLSKVKTLIENKNAYLEQHKKASVDIAKRDVEEKISQLKLNSWCSIEINERIIELKESQENLAEDSKLDGCYIIKTDLQKEKATAELVHSRYKDLSQVESAFRTSKTVELEMRPINVRKESRTRGHVFVVMLSYMIVQELSRLWTGINLKVQEGLNELSTLCLIEVCNNGVSMYNSITKPRESVKRLLEDAQVTLPAVVKSKKISVATRKKLNTKRNLK